MKWLDNLEYTGTKEDFFYPEYFLIQPSLNQAVKFRLYLGCKKNFKEQCYKNEVLDCFYEKLEYSLRKKSYQYIVKKSQVRCSFYVLIHKRRGEILGADLNYVIKQVKNTFEKIFRDFSKKSKEFLYSFFRILYLLDHIVTISIIF